MDMHTEPQPLDLSYHLPGIAYCELVYQLRRKLPLPDEDTPEAFAQRDNAAIAVVASLLPANAGEALIAAQFVATDAQASHAMQLALRHPASIELGLKCLAQAASMTRQSHSARRLLMRVQAERRKLEADGGVSEKAAWIEHCAIGMMTQALPDAPPLAAMEPPPPPVHEPPQPEADTEPYIDPVAAAEEYAILYPDRARLIRSRRGLPDRLDFGPPEDDLVQALVTGRTPALLALDNAEVRAA
jgi:hypothetical protein